MTRFLAAAFGLMLLPVGHGQDKKPVSAPFTLTWSEGKCLGCKIAAGLGHVRFVSRRDVWAVGYNYGPEGSGDFVVIHSADAGRTWREVQRTYQHAGDPDGPPAFSFLDAPRGWVSRWDYEDTDEPQVISTRDGGQHWQTLSQQFLQRMQFIDDTHGYGTLADQFFRTNDGGRSWVKTKMPDIGFVDQMVFATPDSGWIAGINEKDLLVFRTVNGGKDWEESRTTLPQALQRVRDLFFLDQQRGWLTAWNQGPGLYLTVDGGKHWVPDPNPLFQKKRASADVVRFTSKERGFVLGNDARQSVLIYTMDGGAHWSKQALPNFVDACQVFESDLLCTSGPGFRLLTLHPM